MTAVQLDIQLGHSVSEFWRMALAARLGAQGTVKNAYQKIYLLLIMGTAGISCKSLYCMFLNAFIFTQFQGQNKFRQALFCAHAPQRRS